MRRLAEELRGPAAMPKEQEGDEWKAATKLAAVHKGRAARQHVKGQMEAA